MKLQTVGKVYNTETGVLMKFFVRTEDLGAGYVRTTTYKLYSGPKEGNYFLHIEKVTTEKKAAVMDRQDYIYPVNLDFAREFDTDFDELPLLS